MALTCGSGVSGRAWEGLSIDLDTGGSLRDRTVNGREPTSFEIPVQEEPLLSGPRSTTALAPLSKLCRTSLTEGHAVLVTWCPSIRPRRATLGTGKASQSFAAGSPRLQIDDT